MKEILNCTDEVHAFFIGLGEGICLIRPIFKMPIDYDNPLKGEYHYYVVGRAIGFLCLLGVIVVAIKLLGG